MGRERQRERDRERETERERENPNPSRFHPDSVEPDMGLKPTNCEIMT